MSFKGVSILRPWSEYVCLLWVGPPRSGKSYSAVVFIWFWLLSGNPVLSNIYMKKQPKRLLGRVGAYEFFHEFEEFESTFKRCRAAHAGHLLVVLDEVGNSFDSRDFKSFPKFMRYILSQHSKEGCSIITIAQHEDQIDKKFKLVSPYTVHHINGARQGLGALVLGLFFQNFHFQWVQSTNDSSPKPKKTEKRFFFPKEPFRSAYDTYQKIEGFRDVGGGSQAQVRKFSWGRKLLWVIGIWAFIRFGPMSKVPEISFARKASVPMVNGLVMGESFNELAIGRRCWDLETSTGICSVAVPDEITTDIIDVVGTYVALPRPITIEELLHGAGYR
jgi:hypothetical protein